MRYGECFAFVFIPMVFLGLYNLLNTEKNHYHLIFGTCGLILSHNLSTLLTAIFAFLYCIINGKNLARTQVKKGLAIDLLFILLITSFFWMPLLETKFYTNYRVYEENAMANQESFLEATLELKDLFITKKDSLFLFEIGLPVICMLMFSIITWKNREENKKEYRFFLGAGILSLWMATKYFPWKILPDACYIIQFPWRMLLFSTFFFAIIVSINMTTIIKNFCRKDVLIIGVIAMIYISAQYGIIQYSEKVQDIKEVPIRSVTEDNTEWIPGMGRLEYLPTRAYNHSAYIANRENKLIILEGTGEIYEETKKGNQMTAKIATKDEKIKLELPYIYYPGYTVKLDGITVETYETENGFLGCQIEKNENGEIQVDYTGTSLMNFSKIIAGIAWIVCMIYVWKKR